MMVDPSRADYLLGRVSCRAIIRARSSSRASGGGNGGGSTASPSQTGVGVAVGVGVGLTRDLPRLSLLVSGLLWGLVTGKLLPYPQGSS
jgi:hypothetical protein